MNLDAYDKELRKYIYEQDGTWYVSHPLVHGLLWPADMVNLTFTKKKELAEKYKVDKNWLGYVFLHERPYRFTTFQSITDQLSPQKYWGMVGSVWEDSENIWQHREDWREVWEADRTYRNFAMDADEKKVYKKLPSVVTAYRGIIGNKFANMTLEAILLEEMEFHGISWTTDLGKARWFANRFGQKGVVLKTTVSKAQIAAYKDGRNEKELVIPNLLGSTIEVVEAKFNTRHR